MRIYLVELAAAAELETGSGLPTGEYTSPVARHNSTRQLNRVFASASAVWRRPFNEVDLTFRVPN